MKTKILVILMVGVVGLAGWLTIDNRRLGPQLALSTSKTRLPARDRADATAPPSADETAPLAAAAPASRAKPWLDPSWKSARLEESYLRVESTYGRAFQKLAGWSPERREALKRQLANNDVAVMLAAMPANVPPTAEDQKAQGEAVRATQAGNQQQLRDLMGDADYSTFDAAQKMEAYRGSVDTITNAMRANSFAVGNDTEESILAAYSNAAQEAAAQAGSVDVTSLSEAQFAAVKQQQDHAFQLILMRNLSSVLDETQLQAFMTASMEH